MGEQQVEVTPVPAQHEVALTDASTADSQQGQDPATGAGNGSPNADDATTRADAPEPEASGDEE